MVSFTIEKDIDMLKKERLVKIAHNSKSKWNHYHSRNHG